jgi:hypothetical protein
MGSARRENPTETNSNGLTFASWLALASARVETRVGLSLDDLPDGNTWDAWHAGEDPADYADQALEDEGLDPDD